MLKQIALWLAAILGVAALGNGVFMLISPEAWYVALPGVTTTGPFNQHFIRDIGLIFVFMGVAFLLGVARPPLRLAAWSAATLWLTGHALFHVWEVAAGICGPSVLVRDFPAVTTPALLGWALVAWAAGQPRGRTP